MLRNVNDNNKVQAAIVTARPARVKADEKQLRRKLPKGGQRSLRDVAAEAQNQSSRVIARLPRWAGKSGSGQTRQGSDRAHVSGVPPAADIRQRGLHVGSAPQAVITRVDGTAGVTVVRVFLRGSLVVSDAEL